MNYLVKTWLCSFAMVAALIFTVDAYLSEPEFGEEGVVKVDTVDELYEAVNDPNSAGDTIKLLASGSPYVLDPTKPNAGSAQCL